MRTLTQEIEKHINKLINPLKAEDELLKALKVKLTKKELKRLMKKLNEKRMPTMVYQTQPPKERKNDTNPW